MGRFPVQRALTKYLICSHFQKLVLGRNRLVRVIKELDARAARDVVFLELGNFSDGSAMRLA